MTCLATRRPAYVADLVSQGQAAAADTLMRDRDDFVRFYRLPQEHWIQQPARVDLQGSPPAD